MPKQNRGQTTRSIVNALTTEERRKMVAANLISGMSYRDIATHLDVSKSTINRDVQALKEQWYNDASDKVDRFVGLHTHRLNVLLNALWGEALNGNVKAIDRVLSIMDRQASLHGIPANYNLGNRSREDERLDSVEDFLANKEVRAMQLREVMFAFADKEGNIDGFEADITVE
ncbi:MAG: helix-turn-helix domain-containing protein [Chloroflexota bacterium]